MNISCGYIRGWPNPLVELTRYSMGSDDYDSYYAYFDSGCRFY